MLNIKANNKADADTIKRYFKQYIYSASDFSVNLNLKEATMNKPVKELGIIDDGSLPYAAYWYVTDDNSSHVEPIINDNWKRIRDEIQKAQSIMEAK